MTTKVGAITVELTGTASALEAATAKGAAALLRVKQAGQQLADGLLKTTQANDQLVRKQGDLLGSADRLTGKIETLRQKQLALASALGNADAATRSNAARMAALRHELESTTAQLNRFTGQNVQMVQGLARTSSTLATTGDRMKGLHGDGMKAVAAMSAMSGALATTDSKVAQFATGIMGIAGAFIAGGPLLGGIALLGTLLGVVVSHFGGIEKAAQKAVTAAATALAKLREEVDRLGIRLLSLQSGTSVEVLTAEADVRAASANAEKFGGADHLYKIRSQVEAGVLRGSAIPEGYEEAIGQLETAAKKLKLTKDAEAAEASKALAGWLERNRQQEEALREQRALEAQARKDEAEANRIIAGIDMDRELGTPDRVPFSGLEEISVEDLNRELGITETVMGAVVYDLDAYNKNLQDQADALEAAQSERRARFEGAAGTLAGALQSGSLSLDTVGTAIGMAAGGPMGAAVGSSLSGVFQEFLGAMSGGVSKVFGGAGEKVTSSMETGVHGGLGAAGMVAAIPVFGPVIAAVAGPLVGLATMFLDLSTKTQAFANLQRVAGMALEVLIDPLGMLWSALYPVAGAFLQVAKALAPLFTIAMMFLPLEPVVWILVEAIKLASLSMLSIIAGFASGAKALIDLLEEKTGLNLPGDKALGDVADAAVAAMEDIQKITVETGLETFWDAINDNTDALREFSDSLTNIPSGYRVPYYDASDPSSNPAAGASGTGRGPKDPSRGSRTAGNITVNGGITIVAKDTSVFDALHREAARRFGTNRGLGGGLPDLEN